MSDESGSYGRYDPEGQEILGVEAEKRGKVQLMLSMQDGIRMGTEKLTPRTEKLAGHR
jgi:hypothetical protein